MTWKSSNSATSPRSGRASSFRHRPESSLQRLIRLVADERGVHAFIHRATADQGVVEETRVLTRMLLGGQDIPESCLLLCQRLGVEESLLRARLWAVTSLFPDQQSVTASPYEILGVEPWSDQDAIKRAFRALCLKWHPDHNPDDPEAVTRFRRIKAAYDMVKDPVATQGQGWGPPAGVNVWEEPGLCEEKRTWPRLRLLAPLALVVGFLVLVVGFADLLIQYPRPRYVSRDTSQNDKKLPEMKLPGDEVGAHQDARESLIISSQSSEQSAVATVVQPSDQMPGAQVNSTNARFNVSQGPLPELAGDKLRQDVALSDSGREGALNGVVVADVEAPKSSKPSMPGDTVAEEPSKGPDRGSLAVSPESARKVESPTSASTQSPKQLQGPEASLPLPTALPAPSAKDVLLDEPASMNVDVAMVDLHKVEERLEKFLAIYARDYSRRDLERFMGHFTSHALENGTPLGDLQPLYQENFRNISTIRYKIMVDSMSVGDGQVYFKGRFELKGLHADGQPFVSLGTLSMDLEPVEETFRVRSLEYSFR